MADTPLAAAMRETLFNQHEDGTFVFLLKEPCMACNGDKDQPMCSLCARLEIAELVARADG
jgi:hypothetical protein